MEYQKICVEVTVRFLKEGGMRPVCLVWEDGRRFAIDRVKHVQRASARVGAELPVRYTCVIEGRERMLYFEEGKLRWFVEKLVLKT